MEQLIWYSVPGAVFVTSLWLACPAVHRLPDAIVLGLTVVVGFALHQCFRAVFEACRGWESLLRPVNKTIKDEYKIATETHRAFLIWEITFYGDSMPASFREHNRGAWHYIMSFWSISFACVLANVYLVIELYRISRNDLWLPIVIVSVVALVFLVKGWLTAVSICRQEVVIFWKHKSQFDTTSGSVLR